MRFGCCGNLVAVGSDKTGIEIVEKIAAYGYDYIELPMAEMTALNEADFVALKARVAASGIACEVCNNLFPATIRLTGADMNMKIIKAYLEKAMGRAQELGVSYVVFGSGGAKTIPQDFPMEEGYKQLVKVSKVVAQIAAAHNVVIVIEPLRKPECNIINTFAEGVTLAQAVNHHNMKVLVDYFHLSWEHEPVSVLLQYGKEFLRHIHFAYPNIGRVNKDALERTYPADTAEWDYRKFFEVIKAIGYDNRISVEAFTNNFDMQAVQALKFLKDQFP